MGLKFITQLHVALRLRIHKVNISSQLCTMMALSLPDHNDNIAFSFEWSGFLMLSCICFTFNYHFHKMICHIEVLLLMTHELFYEKCSPIMVEIKLLLLRGMCH